jgi:hypothetical protein
MQRDGATRAPDEIAWMGRDDQPGLLFWHKNSLCRARLVKLGRAPGGQVAVSEASHDGKYGEASICRFPPTLA